MKQFIFLLAMFLTSTLGFGQVQNTPSIIEAKPSDIWQFIQSIGYTEDVNIVDEIKHSDWHMRYYTAKNPSDNSTVKMTTKDDGYFGEWILYVVYTWDKKKYMPQTLEKIDSKTIKIKLSEYSYTQGRYKNHYIVSIMNNPMKKIHGSNPNNFFQIFVNGQSVTGFY